MLLVGSPPLASLPVPEGRLPVQALSFSRLLLPMPVRNFSRLALVFVVLFAVLVLSSLVPFQPLDPAWQSRLTAVLVNAGTLPLTALALLQLAFLLDPEDPDIQRRLQRFAQLSIAVALGYLLLAPLQISASLRLQSRGSAEQLSRLARAEAKLQQLRQAARQAASGTDLSARFQALSGPSISPAELSLPLPVLKAQAALALDQAQAQLQRQRSALPASDPLRLLPELLRNAVSCLALACGFAIFARARDSELSLVDFWQDSLERRRLRRASRSARQAEEDDYVRQLSGEDGTTSKD